MWAAGAGRDESGSGGGEGGHLKLFKQISEEYQSPRTRREMLLVYSPAAGAFIPPLRGNFIMIRKTGSKRTRLWEKGLGESSKNHMAVGVLPVCA